MHSKGDRMNDDRITRKEARVLATDEFEKFAALAASLTPKEWATDTDCTGWDVRSMILHVLGSPTPRPHRWSFCTSCDEGFP